MWLEIHRPCSAGLGAHHGRFSAVSALKVAQSHRTRRAFAEKAEENSIWNHGSMRLDFREPGCKLPPVSKGE